MLRTKGLLDVTPGRGSFIRTPDKTQWMTEMLAACSAQGLSTDNIMTMRTLLQRHVIASLTQVPDAARRDLIRHSLKASFTPTDNAKLEQQWLVAMATLAGNPLQTMMIDCLCMLATPTTHLRFATPSELARTLHAQTHVNEALAKGAWPQAEQALWHYFAGDTAPAATTIILAITPTSHMATVG